MASRERIKKRKVPGKKAPVPVPTPAKKPELIPGKSKVDDDAEDTAGSQVSVREASRENITDNTRMEPVKTSTPLVTETQTEEKDPSKSSRDFKKKKKDHVEQKREGRHRSPSPNPSLSAPGEKKRAPSPSRKNVVNPINVVEDRANMGSAVSIRTNASYSSLKEAWVENENKGAENDSAMWLGGGRTTPVVSLPDTDDQSNKEKAGCGAWLDQKKRGGKVSPLTNMSPSTNASSNPATGKLNTLQGIKGIKVNEDEVEEEDSPEKHAYIPYLYARTCIAKIMEDMKKMKGNHLVIVESIQHQYRTVENDTQTQFNMFVICLREEYATKQKTFRQVIDLHRAELERKEKYWNEMLASLAERNNRLLKEKKVLLLENTTEIERLVKEKDQVRHDMGEKIDKLQAAPDGSPQKLIVEAKPSEQNIQAVLSFKNVECQTKPFKESSVPVPVPTGWESEKKILEDELSSEKMEKGRLQEQLSAGGPTEVTSPSVYSTEVSQKHSLEKSAAGTIVVAGVLAAGKEDRKRMDLERQDMDEERQALGEERKAFEMERESFDEDQKKWMGQISDLQENLGAKNVESGEWKVKYDTMKTRLDEAAGIQAKYQTLESQYQALALLVSASDNKVAAQEQAQKTHDEKVMMDEEKQKMEKEIGVWEKHFEKKNGRKPTEEDKNDSVTEMYVQREELQFMVNSLEKKEATLKAVESGHVPEPPEVPPPVNNKEPEVVTVQVKVPDPTITMELSKSQEMVITLRTQITTLHQEISELNGKISQQNQELSKQRGRIVQLENDVAALRAGGATAASTTTTTTTTSSSASNEETEALKKENRELRTDMKKMIKQYERMKERDKVKADGEEGSPEQAREVEQQLHSLDNKVADLEAENETLREEKVILKERIRTEVITITHMEERGKELDQMEGQMEDLSEELERVKQENHEMHKDMKKMIKTHNKMKAKLEHLQGSEKAVHLLEIVSMMVHQIHNEVPDAAGKVNTHLDDVENEVIELKQDHDAKKMAADMWSENYKKTHGNAPGEKDRDADGEAVYKELDEARQQFKDKMLHVSALQLMKTGDIRKAVDRPESVQSEVELEKMEKQLVAADDKMIDLETENGAIKSERDKYKEKINDLEQTLDEMKNQAQVQAMLAADTESSAELTEQLSEIQKKCDRFEAELMQEKMSHVNTQEELENVKNQMNILREEIENEKKEIEVSIQTTKVTTQVEVEAKEEELKEVQQRLDVLETERLSKLPPDTAAEIKTLQEKLKEIKQERSSTSTTTVVLETSIKELTTKLETTSKNLETQRAATRELESKMKNSRHDKEKEVKKMSRHLEEKEHKRTAEDKNRINMLVKRVKELEAVAGKGGAVAVGAAAGRAAGGGDQGLKEQNMALKMEIKDLKNRIKQLETDLRSGGGRPGTAAAGGGAGDRMKGTRPEKILKELEKKLDYEKNKSEKLGEGLKAADEENKALKKELDEKSRNLAKVQAELKTLGFAAKEGVEAATKVKDLETDNKKLTDENNSLLKNFESERVLRKKYYNMVEDMKGKIRVYCRARPLSGSEKGRGNKAVVTSLDEYSINVVTARGMKDFQYDQVFMEDSTQEKIFEDTNNLIQSAVDGYNVCIFAYGQTGSGKTFTMIGDRAQQYPGIAPRAFNRVFELIHELRNKFVIEVEVYMLELYNEKLIDLFARPGMSDDEKLDIKKDKKGLVYIQGSVVKAATNAKELFALFEDGSANRHVASTKMNAESSRSHLVVGITMECTNRNTGTVTKGKLSLVDLAGSERVAKTQAGAEQLKEAMSINKSLSALGDVISALSSEQSFIPYRNNKLTMLMQDSLGGNAKTLMFVNVSPADYNADETVVSLTYASRVKLITNDASKNADNKEISRLKAVISKLKQGEKVDEEEAS